MQKLSGTSSGKNNNSLSYFATNPTKLVLYFSDFSTIFYVIYKNQENHFTIWVIKLQEGPWKEMLLCNAVPGAAGRRDSGEIPAGLVGVRPGEGGKEV
jgi:hypothetical protein